MQNSVKPNKKQFGQLLLATCLIAFMTRDAAAEQVSPTKQTPKPAIADQAELAKVVQKLKDPSSRLKTMAVLIDFASGELYQNSGNMQFYLDGKTRKLHQDAANAVYKASDDATICQMLLSHDEHLQCWATYAIGEKNVKVVPTLKEVLSRKDYAWNDRALEKLQLIPGNDAFVKNYITNTKDAWILVKQLHDEKEFNQRILALLQDKDETIRVRTLTTIAANKIYAEMFHRPFSKEILEQAIKLGASKSAAEKAAAVSAAISLRRYDEESVFSLMSRLYQNESADVREKVALGLKDSKQPQSQEMLKALLKDSDEQVLFAAIIADGVSKHKAELEKLSHSKNENLRDMAKSWMNEPAEQK